MYLRNFSLTCSLKLLQKELKDILKNISYYLKPFRSISEKTADNLDLKMIYDYERPCAETADGYYSTACINGAEYNIIYTDYATNETIALCNRAECKHNDNNCMPFSVVFFHILGH